MLTKLRTAHRIELLVFGLIAAFLVIKAYLITPQVASVPEFLELYKFTSNDSYDWIANGLGLFENDSITYRNPGLPLMIKGLNAIQAVALLPFMNHAALFFLTLFTYLTAKKIAGMRPALIIAVAIALNFTYQAATNYILADVYAVALLSGATYSFVSRRYYAALAFLGASLLFQNIGYFILVIGIIVFATEHQKKLKKLWRKRDWRVLRRAILLSAAALSPIIVWNFYRLVKFGNPLYTKVDYFELLKPDLDAVLFYGMNSITMFGLIVIPTVAYFLFKGRNLFKHSMMRIVLYGFIFNVLFWVLLYDWTDRRFLLYFIPFLYPIMAFVLSRIQKNTWALIACAAVLFYPSTLPVKSFATGNELPLTHTRYLQIDHQADGSFAFALKSRSEYQSWLAPLQPTLYQTVENSTKYRTKPATVYRYYSTYIENNYDPTTNTVCYTRKSGLSKYLVSSMLYINLSADLDKVKFDDCPAKL